MRRFIFLASAFIPSARVKTTCRMSAGLRNLARAAAAALALLALAAPTAHAAPDAATKQAAIRLAENLCATCHGAQGRGDNPRIPPTDAKLAAAGKQLFEQGSPERGAPPCTGCHGMNAEGLAGQHSEYLYIQLKLIQNRLRTSPVMHGLTKQLSGEEISAVVTYLQSR